MNERAAGGWFPYPRPPNPMVKIINGEAQVRIDRVEGGSDKSLKC